MRSVTSHAVNVCPSDTPHRPQCQTNRYPTAPVGCQGIAGTATPVPPPAELVTALGAACGQQFGGGLMRVLRIKLARRARLLGSPWVFAELGQGHLAGQIDQHLG